MGFFSVPPAYPTRVRQTPGNAPNWASGPQNQPSANVAVSSPAGASASSAGPPVFSAAMAMGASSGSGRPQAAAPPRSAASAIAIVFRIRRHSNTGPGPPIPAFSCGPLIDTPRGPTLPTNR